MAWVAVAVAGTNLISGMMSSNAQEDAANTAAGAQGAAAQAEIAERRRQFDQIQQLLSPYTSAGSWAVKGQRELIGLDGAGPQQAAINAIQNGPEFGAMRQLGEESILQNASATGGLRGGNTQAALGQFSPMLLSQLINQRYGQLGGLTSIGQNAAAGVGNAGLATANGIGGALQGLGAAQAGAALAAGQASANRWGSLAGSVGMFGGLGGFKGFGGPSGGGWDWTGMPGSF